LAGRCFDEKAISEFDMTIPPQFNTPVAVNALGCAVLLGVFSPNQVLQLIPLADEAVRTSSSRAGARIGVDTELVQRVLNHEPYATAIQSLGDYRPVRVIVFDKSADQNWAVAWHRDTAIAVQERHEVEGFGPWSIKNGVHHVQPPPSVLRDMVTARLHLDPTPASNGALQVIPESHLDIGEDWPSVDQGRMDREPFTLEANAGDVVLMNPLTLHASSKSSQPAHRRVVHIEFARSPLPEPLKWFVDQSS
jgi:Phytanoyl-CoA dioxygenase (PhyH)